jgi:hypothetical protein
MKKQIALTLVVLSMASGALAATSGTLTIQGTVASTVSIVVTPVAGYNTLDIEAGLTDQHVADITEKCNNKTGYTVTMTSLNAGGSGNSLFLADSAGAADTVPYTLSYNSTAVTFNSGSATLTSANAKTAKDGVVKPLAATIAASWVNAATYADTLTFTIASK